MKRKTFMFGLMLAAVMMIVSTSAAAVRHLYVAATDGYVWMPEGEKIYIRGFMPLDAAAFTTLVTAAQNGDTATLELYQGKATLPAPIIDVNEGDDVFLHVVNIGNLNATAPADPHTVHLHGIHSTTQNDGFPENSFVLQVPGAGAGPTSYSAAYYFKADRPGTYMWHCHVEASEHVQMGMYGAMIIRPTCGPQTAYGGLFGDQFDHEYILLLSDVDPVWHAAIEKNFVGTYTTPEGVAIDLSKFNPVDFKPAYWLVNGRPFPDCLRPVINGPMTAPGQGPYSGFLPGSNNLVTYKALVEIPNFERAAAKPEALSNPRVLLRMISLAFQTNPWHFHGYEVRTVGKDSEPVPSIQQKLEFTKTIGSGETYDLIVTANKRKDLGRNAKKSPGVVGGDIDEKTAGYMKALFDLTCTVSTYPQADCDPTAANKYRGMSPATNNLDTQWFPHHNHDDYKVTNFGLYPGGHATLFWLHPGPMQIY